ncbi:phytanoyl-CoA dioxygenase family protein [Streptomyces abikoensis]
MNATSAEPGAVAAALRADGYAVVRGLVPVYLLEDFGAQLAGRLLAPGTLQPDPHRDAGAWSAAESGLARLRAWRPDQDGQIALRTAGYRSPAQHQIAHYPALAHLMADLLGGKVWVQPRRFLRLVAPGPDAYATEPHQDYRYVQGALDTLTAWIALHGVDADGSALRVVPGSHRRGLWPVTDVTGGTLPHPVGIEPRDARWTVLPVAAGDVVVFHSLTLHCTTPPRGHLARLSLDLRYQRTSAPLASTALLAPYPCTPNDDPTKWAHDPHLDLPDPLPLVPGVPHTDVTVPSEGVSRFA